MTKQHLFAIQLLSILLLGSGAAAHVAAQECKKFVPVKGPPEVAKGYTANVIIQNLSNPRGLVVDTEGNLLIVERGKGISAVKIIDTGPDCVTAGRKTTIVADSALNHAVALSVDGKKLYASDADKLYSWDYDTKLAKTTSSKKTLVKGMYNTGHSTRTILVSKKAPGTVLLSRGSQGNIDPLARDIKTGHSQIRAFDISNSTKVQEFSTGGKLIGWGLRNSVGVGENPTDGGLWSNENASDNLKRDGKDIHENSPGEEINYHGTLVDNKFTGQGKNYGYPDCAAVWQPADIPRNAQLRVGTQFLLDSQVKTLNDTMCQNDFVSPRITLPSHWAPMDIKFNSQGTIAYMTSRGSWNKDNPDGYRLFAISYKDGQPVHPPESTTAAIPIVKNPDQSLCPERCFRPVGLAFDAKGRLFMASDTTGEIFLVGRTDGKTADSVTLETQYKSNLDT